MGQSSSSLPSSLPDLALHCLRVADHSPAADIIEPFFDYLIGVDEATQQQSDSNLSGLSAAELGRILEENEGRRIGLKVYNSKTQRIRDVSLIPSRAWSEEALRRNGESLTQEIDGQIRKPSLLGLSLRLCNPAQALESVWHILEISEGSPAEMAGLVPFGDWICGWAGGPLHSESDFYDLVEAHIDKPLRLYVYSADLDNLREVIIVPNRQWGGQGLLGCGVGFGLLHRIPRPVEPPSRGADGYFLSANGVGSNTFVPATHVPQ